MQKSILSFFTPKPQPKPACAPISSPEKRKLSSPQTPNKCAKLTQKPNSLVGKRVEIYWIDDDAWYPGTICTFHPPENYTIDYDDGDTETVDFRMEKYRFITTPMIQSQDTETEEEESFPIHRISQMETLSDDEVISLKPVQKANQIKAIETDSEDETISFPTQFSSPTISTPHRLKKGNKTKQYHSDSEESAEETEEDEIVSTQSTPTRVKRSPKTSRSPDVNSSITERGNGKAQLDLGEHEHNRLDWLTTKLKDKKGHTPSDPNYDCHTLLVPSNYLEKQTPGVSQWWKIKQDYFDTVLFFKLGKFYELYHFDADIAVRELELIFMKGEFAHAGFPEPAYPKYSKLLIDKGYRVARIEQTETPSMLKERNSGSVKKAKCVNREICNVVSKGIQIYTVHDDSYHRDPNPLYILSIFECNQQTGLCWSDTASGVIKFTQFQDDTQKSVLKTMIIEIHPSEVLYCKQNISVESMSVLKYHASDALFTSLLDDQFLPIDKSFQMINKEKYFLNDKNPDNIWPQELCELLNEQLTGFDEVFTTTLRSFGGLLFYFHYCAIDYQVISMKNISYYLPPPIIDFFSEQKIPASASNNIVQKGDSLIMDGVTIQNLELFDNNIDNTGKGTLFHYLDHCETSFGRRFLKELLCHPPNNVQLINNRLDAVEDLMNNPHERDTLHKLLQSLPDLERTLAQLNGIGCLKYHPNHPELRAILQDEIKYNKQKINTFLKTIQAFKNVQTIPQIFNDLYDELKSPFLKSMVRAPSDKTIISSDAERFPNYQHILDFFDHAFNHKAAEESGTIKPNPGVDESYDQAIEIINQTEKRLESYLNSQKTKLQNPRISYFGKGKDRNQIEIQDSSCSHLPDDYLLTSQKKGFRRYRTPFITSQLEIIQSNEEKRDVALNHTIRTLFSKFSENSTIWNSLLEILSELDLICSLSIVSAEGDNRGDMCRPEFIENDTPILSVTNSRHPCVTETYSKSDFISNDIHLGDSGSNCMLLTGPNMGGKSTILRQSCILVLLSHMGCYVPASSCRLTPVDRIFSRIGASDKILSGESTFFVEMSETSTILNHATNKSLVIMDELGRGTSTYDGTSIAYATLKYISEHVGCLLLFSTHYHSLVDDFSNDSNIKLQHMDSIVNQEDESLIFLYKLIEGSCPRSYGMNVAKIAKLPEEVITKAKEKSEEMEMKFLQQNSYVDILRLTNDITQIREIQRLL